ncbi:hypothetical protein B296_00025936 [Ensete ventricosum]|uniref:Ribosomal protein/NADH dehydrogenase domain-containing protein n=1 Tax=Ensete ventricosum TaxID=4639 RepID=A0A426YHP3_ENSVE|nr:hypothetical protein B296_00025936 [Ensete ventricosum]
MVTRPPRRPALDSWPTDVVDPTREASRAQVWARQRSYGRLTQVRPTPLPAEVCPTARTTTDFPSRTPRFLSIPELQLRTETTAGELAHTGLNQQCLLNRHGGETHLIAKARGDGLEGASISEYKGASLPLLPDFAGQRPYPVLFPSLIEFAGIVSTECFSLYRGSATERLVGDDPPEFVYKNYKDLKTLNPKLPILIRECRGVEPQLWARYGEYALYSYPSLFDEFWLSPEQHFI